MFNLKNLVGRVGAQLNPFDGGKTFNNPNPQQSQPQSQPQVGPQQFAPDMHYALRNQTNMHQMQQFRPTINQQGDPTGYPGAPEVPMGQDPADYGYPPEITVDPSGRMPYSARTPELARLGNQYTANPTANRFLGVDPAQFGYPADNSVNALKRLLRK